MHTDSACFGVLTIACLWSCVSKLGNQIGVDGVRALALGLEQTSLTSLDLGGMYECTPASSAQRLQPRFSADVLVSLDRWMDSVNSMGAAGARALAAVLPGSQLIFLNIRRTYCSFLLPAGWPVFFPFALMCLIIYLENVIGTDGIQALASVLDQTRLTTLHLNCTLRLVLDLCPVLRRLTAARGAGRIREWIRF